MRTTSSRPPPPPPPAESHNTTPGNAAATSDNAKQGTNTQQQHQVTPSFAGVDRAVTGTIATGLPRSGRRRRESVQLRNRHASKGRQRRQGKGKRPRNPPPKPPPPRHSRRVCLHDRRIRGGRRALLRPLLASGRANDGNKPKPVNTPHHPAPEAGASGPYGQKSPNEHQSGARREHMDGRPPHRRSLGGTSSGTTAARRR